MTWRSTGWKHYKKNQIYFFRHKIKHTQLLQLVDFLRKGLVKTLFYPFHGNVSFEGLLAERKGRAVGLLKPLPPAFPCHQY